MFYTLISFQPELKSLFCFSIWLAFIEKVIENQPRLFKNYTIPRFISKVKRKLQIFVKIVTIALDIIKKI